MSAIWDEQLEIRQLIIEYAQEVREIDQENFHVKNWELITVASEVIPDPDPEPKPEPKPDPKPVPKPEAPVETGKGTLPKTGADALPLLAGALILLTLGGAGIAAGKRRKSVDA